MFRADCLLLTDSLPVCWSYEWSFSLCGLRNQGKYYQQSKISESIQMYKNFTKKEGTTYPYEKEKDLITKVKTGNAKEAKSILNDLLGYVLFSEGNNLDVVKSRAIELSSLCSRSWASRCCDSCSCCASC